MRNAAEYIRMSTDRQDLSPALQHQAIAEYAATNDLQITASYIDQGRSGLTVERRDGLQRLLADVEAGTAFTTVLVYDVSRWGRFQDMDAAAYYEYHCRLHGVQVIYVAETFTNDMSPANVIVKHMKRMMAAEYSRELAGKSRAGQHRIQEMGFHMGHLPPLGYRRVSVSADGRKRVALVSGELKRAFTDRIEWVLGPETEVALVRRGCIEYATGIKTLKEIAGLLKSSGLRSARGKSLDASKIRTLFENEALIGNFVWGQSPNQKRLIPCRPTRVLGSVPRIIDDETWIGIQARLDDAGLYRKRSTSPNPAKRAARLAVLAENSKARKEGRTKTAIERIAMQLESGKEAHSDEWESLRNRALKRTEHARELGRFLTSALIGRGISSTFEANRLELTTWLGRARLHLAWPAETGLWRKPWRLLKRTDMPLLIVRMSDYFLPLDFLLMPAGSGRKVPTWLEKNLPSGLRRYQYADGDRLMDELAKAIPSISPNRLK